MKRLFASHLLIALVACSGQVSPTLPTDAPSVDRAPAVEGVPDRGADPAVIGVEAPGQSLCAGALVSRDVVLTGRFCVPADVSTLRVFVGDEASTAPVRARGWRVLAIPADAPNVAFVLLDTPIDDVEPLAVRPTGVATGDHVRTVGFARGAKLVRDHVAVVGTGRRVFEDDEAACAVGAGAPAIDETTGEVVGVLASGGPGCATEAGHDVYTRADLLLPFAAEAVALGPPRVVGHAARERKGPVDMGASCVTGSDCAAGACVTYAGARYCSRTCDAHDRCPSTLRCMGSHQGVMVCVER
ncbi:MAG TPA: trypsin-like serine protease [Polyangiaceae bacterium]|jgi:hypothetical protein